MVRKAFGWLLVGIFASSCVTGAKLREDAKAIEVKLQAARERGAYRCAPAELARADANLEFLKYEVDEGDFRRADWHRRAALENVDRAIEITNPDVCADKRVIISEQKPIIITKTDRDGDGILDETDQCPDEPEDFDSFQDEDGCPDPDNDSDTVLDVDDQCPMEPGDPKNAGCPVNDRDQDGIPDETDKCPDIPEDQDGNEDQDGCPEEEVVDTDGDTVLDPQDACPMQPGPVNNSGCPLSDRDGDGITDDIDQCPDVPGLPPSGCPKKVLVVKTDKAIEIKQQINFETNKAKIKGAISFEILDQVAAVMKSNPDIRIRIEGHTDSVGDAAKNLKLSDDRANSVRAALIERGTDPGRLEAIGYGESRPIATNKTKKGKAQNRRVEFNIIMPGAPAPEAAPTQMPQ